MMLTRWLWCALPQDMYLLSFLIIINKSYGNHYAFSQYSVPPSFWEHGSTELLDPPCEATSPDLASELWTEVMRVSSGPEHLIACPSFSRQFFSSATGTSNGPDNSCPISLVLERAQCRPGPPGHMQWTSGTIKKNTRTLMFWDNLLLQQKPSVFQLIQ